MAIDLAKELADALRRPEVRDLFRDLVSDAVRQHLLDPRQHDPDELLNAEGAASLIGMTPGALRKAAARGTIRCTRVRVPPSFSQRGSPLGAERQRPAPMIWVSLTDS